MRTSTNYTHQTNRDNCGSSRKVQLPIQLTRLRLICEHCLGNKIWSLQAELEWSSHSPDLAPLNFFFWGAAKAEVYKEKSCSLRHLKQAVETFTQSVTTDKCCSVIESFAVRINACVNRNGAHVENVNYKKLA